MAPGRLASQLQGLDVGWWLQGSIPATGRSVGRATAFLTKDGILEFRHATDGDATGAAKVRTSMEPVVMNIAKGPPRLPTEVIKAPQPVVEKVEEIKVQPPEPPKIEKPAVLEEVKEPYYPLITSKQTVAHGPCDPQAIFETRAALQQVKADVPAHVCSQPYQDADNALVDLQTGFDGKGVAKCSNDAWIGLARQKVESFNTCIKDEIRAAPHVRPEVKVDIQYRLNTVELMEDTRVLWSGENKGFAPELQQPTAEQVSQQRPEEEDLQLPLGRQPEMKPDDSTKDGAITPWTEPGAPPSLLSSQAPVEVVVFLPYVRPCNVATQRRAKGFLCDVRAEH